MLIHSINPGPRQSDLQISDQIQKDITRVGDLARHDWREQEIAAEDMSLQTELEVPKGTAQYSVPLRVQGGHGVLQ